MPSLPRRKAAVAAKMADDSGSLFSAQPKPLHQRWRLHLRQENNLVISPAPKKRRVLCLSKKRRRANEYLFMPRRNPSCETWHGKMYSADDAKGSRGIKNDPRYTDGTALRAAINGGTNVRPQWVTTPVQYLPRRRCTCATQQA